MNPIEIAFSKIKALLRKAKAHTYEALWQELGNICDMFSSHECWNFLKDPGYVAHSLPDA
ncbi:hypothetical protein [Flexibacterium corallicola]|uniref:hypothetical protein n=1 Tax=Flexibacterium corallicola TaxID=3037259 RepID=UPI00286F2403|nr:hypothetical protein [Pseudovibrio sp. M1P-2-3]